MKAYLTILKVAMPLAVGMMNNALLQFTDRAFLARESMQSLEAVLPASMLAYIILGFFQSVVAYSGTFVAQYFGAGERGMCRRCYHAGIWIALAAGLLAPAALPLGDWVFETFSVGADVISREKVYFNICMLGGVFLYGQMAAQAFFTGLGRTKIVLLINVLGNLVNVTLDPLLIYGMWGFPRLGMAGAAYGTVISTALQWMVLAIAAHRIRLPSDTKVQYGGMLALVGRILRFGVPSGAYTVLNSLSFTIFVFYTGCVGHVASAVSNAVFSISYLAFAPMEGFALGAATLVGHDRGRGDDDAAFRTGLRAVVLGCVFAAVVVLIAVIFRHGILSIYAPSDSESAAQFHELGAVLLIMMAAWQVFDSADVIFAGALRGAGDTKFAMWWMLITAFLMWLPLVALVHAVHNTMTALWSTIILNVVIVCIGSTIRWCRGSWRRIRII